MAAGKWLNKDKESLPTCLVNFSPLIGNRGRSAVRAELNRWLKWPGCSSPIGLTWPAESQHLQRGLAFHHVRLNDGQVYINAPRESENHELHVKLTWHQTPTFVDCQLNCDKNQQVGFFKKEARRVQHHYFQIVYTL